MIARAAEYGPERDDRYGAPQAPRTHLPGRFQGDFGCSWTDAPARPSLRGAAFIGRPTSIYGAGRDRKRCFLLEGGSWGWERESGGNALSGGFSWAGLW